MNYKRIFVIALPILIMWFILHELFAIKYRFAKEEFLIKRNYNRNIKQFSDLSKDFRIFPRLRIDFAKESFVDVRLSSQDLFFSHYTKLTDSSSTFSHPEISWLHVTDTSSIFHHKAQQYLCFDFWRADSSLMIKTKDSLFNISSFWQISYEGHLKTDQLNQIYNSTNLNPSLVRDSIAFLIRKPHERTRAVAGGV